jgi:two-component system sensor histidine kinase PilS (NtrC family)
MTDKIFEPFFTTRSHGTGLGLYISREICESNAARLEYLPGPNGGSCFRIHFPRVNGLSAPLVD